MEYDQKPTTADRELKWKIERSKRITASGLAKLNTPGRSKGELFGKTAIDYIDELNGKESNVNTHILAGCNNLKAAVIDVEDWCEQSITDTDITKIGVSQICGIWE